MTHSGAGDPSVGIDEQIVQLRARAESVQEEIQTATATVSSPDGAATVTVGAGGAVTDIRFGNRAYERPPQQLAALLMQLLGKAQQQVSAKVVSAFGGLVGDSSAAMDMLTQFLPADPDAEEEQPPYPGQDPYQTQQQAQPPAPPAAPPRAAEPRATRRPGRRDEHDDSDEGFSNPW